MTKKKVSKKKSGGIPEGSHAPTFTPPTNLEKDFEDWYRRASDVTHAFGPSAFLDDSEDGSSGQPERARWGNQVEFLMSCIATSVGLGNVWRFPFVAYQNGGGAFLIPYVIVLFFVGKPMYYLECALGQFSSRNSVRIWSLCPAMKGVGYAQGFSCSLILSYYVMIIALCQIYLVKSFESTLPWSVCKPEWKHCVPSSASNPVLEDQDAASSAELYFVKIILRQSDGIENGIGLPIWYLAVSLFISWCIIFLIVAQGVKSSGKAAYFLALFPYIVMLVLFFTTTTLPGAGNGIMFFITPQWERLLQLDVWYAAVTQVFFSLSVCTGAIIMFSSYNGFRQNIYRDSMIITTLDTMTSLLSGFTIFGILGNLAYNLNSEVTDVVGSGGTGLAFISYPDAIAKTFQPQLLSVLFFLMMTVLGVGSAVALLSAINTIFLDAFPNVRTIFVSASTCTVGFLIGTIYTTPGGQFILELVDYYGGTFLMLFAAISEVVSVFWIYGLENFCLDIEYMMTRRPTRYWRICWAVFTPIIMMIVFIYAFVSFETLVFGGYYIYPTAAYIAGYVLLAFGMSIVPLFICITMYRSRTGKFKETLKVSFYPKKTWGPRGFAERIRWRKFKSEAFGDQKEVKVTSSKSEHLRLSLTGGYRTNKPVGERRDDDDDDNQPFNPLRQTWSMAQDPTQSSTGRHSSQSSSQGPIQGPSQRPNPGPSQSRSQGPSQSPSQDPSQSPSQGPAQGPSNDPTDGPS